MEEQNLSQDTTPRNPCDKEGVSKMKRRINKEKRRDRLLKLVEIWGLSPSRFMQQQTPGPNPQHGLYKERKKFKNLRLFRRLRIVACVPVLNGLVVMAWMSVGGRQQHTMVSTTL